MAETIELGAPELNIVCDAGSDADFTITLVDPATGNPIDLTGCTVVFSVKFGYAEPSVLLSASSAVAGSSFITVTALSGVCAVHLDHSDTGLLAAPKVMVYDVVVSSSGATNRRLFGKFFTRPQVVV